MKNDLGNILKNLSGRIFTLGITDNKFIDIIVKNNKIVDFLILSIKSEIKYDNVETVNSVKKVKIRKLKRKNKKNKFDYSIFELSDVIENLHLIINESLDFTSKKIYYYGDLTNFDIDKLVKKYTRYGLKVILKKYSNNKFILEIELHKIKKIKRKYYKFIDFLEYIYDSISSLIVS